MDRNVPVIVKQDFNSSISSVWKAITNLDLMKQWYFDNIPDFKAEVGFTTRFNVQAPSRDFLHIWTVTEVDPGKSITYSWEFEGVEGIGITSFDLAGNEEHCTLTLTNVGLENFPQEYPEFTRESCEGGWKYFINDRLYNYLRQDV